MSDTISPSLATKIEKSENTITRALTACEVSPAGQAWIDFAFDPFKDKQGRAPCVGRPDGAIRNIVVSTLVETITITRPPSVPLGSQWDCHVVNLQQNNLILINEWEFIGENTYREFNPPRPQYPYGGVQVMSGPAGSQLGMPQVVANVTVPATYYNGQSNARIIAKAHKLTNTTPKLTVGGNLLFYERTMEDPEDTLVVNTIGDNATAVRYGVLQYYDDRQTFQIPANLIQMPKSRQHNAAKGIYQVCGECSPNNRPGTDKPVGIAVHDGPIAPNVFLSRPGWILLPPTAIATPNVFVNDFPFRSPFNECGSYLTGLSSETTLTLECMWIIETAPPVSDVRMMSLSHPSPPRDNCALEIYTKMNNQKPAGCDAESNGLGDWVQAIGDMATLAGLPGAGLLSTGGKLINKVQDFYQSEAGKDWEGNRVGNNPSQKQEKLSKKLVNIKYDRMFGPDTRPPKKKKNVQNSTPKVVYVTGNSQLMPRKSKQKRTQQGSKRPIKNRK